MPLYDYRCDNGHDTRDKYVPLAKYADQQRCEQCGAAMTKLLSMGRGLCFFEEGRGRWIENLADEPVYVTSHEQHRRLMKENKVQWATLGQGRKGCWV